MNKKLLPLALSLSGALIFGSCSSSNNDTPVTPPSITVTNDSIYDVMSRNYYWDVPQGNKSQDPVAFFNSLLNSEDKYTVDEKEYKYSSIYTASNIQYTTFDIGFEYSAFRYSDGNVLYVIDYIKPGTDASKQNLQRGYLIKSVNGVDVNNSNYTTLLQQAYITGKAVKMQIADPRTNTYTDFTIEPVTNYAENPILLKETISVGTEKMGYLVYNAFNSIYDNYLKAALNEFSGVNYLTIDLRYNAGGSQTSAITLGSAVVANASNKDVFLVIDRKAGLSDYSYPFVSDVNKLSTLKKVYIITGKNTAGIPEVFINGLKPYLNADLVLVGQSTQGRNMAVGSNNTSAKPYTMNIVIGKWANKNTASFDQIVPNIPVQEPDILEDLGSTKEAMLSAVISDITGQPVTSRSAQTTNIQQIGSSLTQKSVANENVANVDLK